MASITRSQRYRRIVTVLIEEGFGTVLDQLGLRAPWIASLRAGRAAGADAYLTPEERVRRTTERLGPTFAKIGQLLSVRRDLVPASYADQLAKLQDEMEPFSLAEARDEIESAFGLPLTELYAEFTEAPAAAASIDQVHMAVLPDGTPVAVKIQPDGMPSTGSMQLHTARLPARPNLRVT